MVQRVVFGVASLAAAATDGQGRCGSDLGDWWSGSGESGRDRLRFVVFETEITWPDPGQAGAHGRPGPTSSDEMDGHHRAQVQIEAAGTQQRTATDGEIEHGTAPTAVLAGDQHFDGEQQAFVVTTIVCIHGRTCSLASVQCSAARNFEGAHHLRHEIVVVLALGRQQVLEKHAPAFHIVLVEAVEGTELGIQQSGAG